MSSRFYLSHAFDANAAQRELAEFKSLLDANQVLKEREHVLKSFDKWPNLCLLIGEYHPRIREADLIKREFEIANYFRADLAVRQDSNSDVCLVEFEPAGENDIFKLSDPKRIPPWSNAMEKGFSQIVDWAWAIDNHRDQAEFKDAFGAKRPKVTAVLVVGRDASLSDHVSQDRWEWRSEWAKFPNISAIFLQTYDELYRALDVRLKLRLGRMK